MDFKRASDLHKAWVLRFNVNMISKERFLIGLLASLFVASIIFSTLGTVQKPSRTASSVSLRSSVAVIPVYGPIQLDSYDLFRRSGIDAIRAQLEEARDRSDVKAVILRVNSPGGPVGSSQELYSTIKAFREQSAKPVVVSIVDAGASGAYWISMAADHIMAQPGSMVGSLGVIIQVPDFTKVEETYGISFKTYKSGKMKDILNPWRPTTVAEKDLIERHLKDVHQQFIDVLIKERGLSAQKAEALADGRIFTGRKALSLGLVDSLGGLDDAVLTAQALAGLKSPPAMIYLHDAPFKQFFNSFGMSMPRFLLPDFLSETGYTVR